METFELQKPIVCELKEEEQNNNAEKTLKQLEYYLKLANHGLKLSPENSRIIKAKESINEDRIKVKKGIEGEDELLYHLQNSYMPMYILHDIYFKNDDNGGVEIDYIVITRKLIYIIECKNYSGDLIVDRQGNFIRVKKIGYEGCDNPVSQNQKHIDFIKEKFKLSDSLNFCCDKLNSVIVFADPKMIIDLDDAPEEMQSQIIKADRIVDYIKKNNNESQTEILSDEQMDKIKNFFLKNSTSNPNDYSSKYEWLKRNVYTKNITKVSLLFLFAFIAVFYIFYFKMVQVPKLLGDSSPYRNNLLEFFKVIFMIYEPLGVASLIIGFIVGLFGKFINNVSTCGCIEIIAITIGTIIYSIIIDPGDSFLSVIMAFILLLFITFAWNILGLISNVIGKQIFKIISKYNENKKRSDI